MTTINAKLNELNEKIDLMNACDLSDIGCGDQDYFADELAQLEQEKENIINNMGEYNDK